MINRRQFLEAVAAAAVLPALRSPGSRHRVGVTRLRPPLPSSTADCQQSRAPRRRGRDEGESAHPRRGARSRQSLLAAAPGRFTWFNSYDVTRPDAEQVLTQAVKDGAQGFGELKFHVAADGPELRRIYSLAADLRVPILIHFQEVDHFPNEGTWSTGYAKTFESILKAYPKTTFIGHADAFWANVSADYQQRGGVSDRSDHARRVDGPMARRLSQSLRRPGGQLGQQRHVSRSRSSPLTS